MTTEKNSRIPRSTAMTHWPAALLLVFFASGAPLATPAQPSEWSAYGGDAGGTRYSALAEITAANVRDLQVAWVFRTGELGDGVKDWSRSAFEATPILYAGALYLTTSSTDVIAIDAASGRLRWRHASEARKDLHYSDGVSRGVSLWVDAGSRDDAQCHASIYAPTLDARLLALDAATGRPCRDFGHGGAVDLQFFAVHGFLGELENRIFKQVRWTRLEDLPEFDFLAADRGLIRDLAAGKLL